MKKDRTITPSELYRNLADHLGMVRWGAASFKIQKRGQILARLISAGEIRPGNDGHRRYPRPDYRHKAITPGQFRSHMSDWLAQSRFARHSIRIESRGKIVAIIAPPPRQTRKRTARKSSP
jgi:hypothetical protein